MQESVGYTKHTIRAENCDVSEAMIHNLCISMLDYGRPGLRLSGPFFLVHWQRSKQTRLGGCVPYPRTQNAEANMRKPSALPFLLITSYELHQSLCLYDTGLYVCNQATTLHSVRAHLKSTCKGRLGATEGETRPEELPPLRR